MELQALGISLKLKCQIGILNANSSQSVSMEVGVIFMGTQNLLICPL